METEPCLLRLLGQQKQWWHWDSFQIGHYCSFCFRLWLQTSKPDLCRIKPLCHVNLFHTSHRCILLNYPGQWWCLEKFSTVTWQIIFMWDDGLQMEHKTFLTGQLEFKILIYTLKSSKYFLFLEVLQAFYSHFYNNFLNVLDNPEIYKSIPWTLF